jgi:hypothetical protein
MAGFDPIERWIGTAAIELDPVSFEIAPHDARFAVLDARMSRARVVMLGETNHFVHEKVEFRLWWLRRLSARRRIVVGEELSWFDAQRVGRYLDDGDERHFDRMATFGYQGDERSDRDDAPTGILAASHKVYPTALFKNEQVRFYRGLRELPNVAGFFGFDIGGHNAGYGGRLLRVPGESPGAELLRLERVRERVRAAREGRGNDGMRADLDAMIDSLRYTALANPAPTYDALRPALALREEAMKRRLAAQLAVLRDDEQLVLMAHAFHLAKDDSGIRGVGVGPGGGRVPSLGHHVAQELGLAPFTVWWLYGAGEDSQPFPDLPKTATYSADSLNARLARRGMPMVLGTAGLSSEVGIGHMYNQVVPVNLSAEADAVFFQPRVSPLR